MQRLRISRWWLLALPTAVALAVGGHITFSFVLHPPRSACGSCHVMTRYVEVSALAASIETLDTVHTRAGVMCLDCHVPPSLMQRAESAAVYLATGTPEVVTRHRYPETSCHRCHGDWERLAAKTDFLVRNPHRSHWPELECGECHRAHGPQVDFCAACHSNGGQRLTGAPKIPRANNPWAKPRPQTSSVLALP